MDLADLVTEHDHCKICDFGLAKLTLADVALSYVGTREFVAPEILSSHYTGEYTPMVDIYSFGNV